MKCYFCQGEFQSLWHSSIESKSGVKFEADCCTACLKKYAEESGREIRWPENNGTKKPAGSGEKNSVSVTKPLKLGLILTALVVPALVIGMGLVMLGVMLMATYAVIQLVKGAISFLALPVSLRKKSPTKNP